MPQTIEQPQSEREKVESWRLHVLIEAGYPLPLAERLAHSEADLHRAVELMRGLRVRDRGRDPALAARSAGAASGSAIVARMRERPFRDAYQPAVARSSSNSIRRNNVSRPAAITTVVTPRPSIAR